MSLKGKITFPVIFFLILIIVLIGVLSVFSYLLPELIESRLISRLEKDAGITDFVFDFRELDLEGADIGALRFGEARNPALIIQSVQIDYSPEEIYQKKIKKVIASGVEIYCEFKNGEFGLRGFDFKKLVKRLQSRIEKSIAKTETAPLLSIESIEVRDATIICQINGRTYRVPFEIDISPEDTAKKILKGTAHIYPRGQKLSATASINLDQQQIMFDFAARAINLARFADVAELIEGLTVSGQADLTGTVNLQLAPFKISAIEVLWELRDSKITYKDIQLQNPQNRKNERRPFRIKINGDGKDWKIRVSDIASFSPVPVRISEITATVKQSGDEIKSAGHLKISLDPLTVSANYSLPIKVSESLYFPANFTATYFRNGKWQFNLTARNRQKPAPKAARFYLGPFEIISQFPAINISGTGSKDKMAATYAAIVSGVHITSKNIDILLPKFVLKGKTDLSKKGRAKQTTVFELQSPDIAMTLDTTKIKLNDVAVSGRLYRNSTGNLDFNGEARFTKAGLNSAQWKFQITDARGKLPIRWPVEHRSKMGSISIAAMRYRNSDLGAMTAKIHQTASGLSFNGELKSHLIPELAAKFSGNVNLFKSKDYETKIQFELSYPEAASGIDLGRLSASAKGFILKGEFLEEGNLVIGKNGFNGSVKSNLNNGKLLHPKNKIAIEGIQIALFIPDLLKMRSVPGQKLKFTRASIGNLNIENGEIDFQIESARSILIEKSHFNWCDGTVDAPAIRLRSGIEDYSLILYCNRLNLAKVLEQFGAASVEAEGELNGRIPLRFKHGQLSFQDGFLFSTPGEPGKIRMTDTEILTAGIPPDTPQYIQMELARKALEDYDYSWAKLDITTEGEDLLLRMQLDGKPAKPLPFVYRKDLGGFAKVEAGIKGSNFQGIRLDVNFRLPLNKIMQYKDLIRMIQQEKE